MSDSSDPIYSKRPKIVSEGIPCFSEPDGYTDNYEVIATDHLDHLKQTGENPFIPEKVWRNIEESTLRLISKYANPDEKVLDVGVGLGRLLSSVPNIKRYGLDISLNYLKAAKKKGIEVCFSRIEDMPYHEGLFDVVVCTDVLEHVLDLNLCVKNIFSALKPNGTLIARVPYKENLLQYTAPDCPYEYVHLRNFDENYLNLLFSKIFSCIILEHTYAWGPPNRDRLRHTSGIRFWDKLKVSTFKRLERCVSNGIYKSFLQRAFLPIECNFVVRKK